ncbi:uncharacterized protein LOC124154450 isoform X2 [Ischnura elegans]|uniref:uncharacterized protein LOC124154450 isoform X2 n=1 Tax=Ischnura elegans TaxID=197161 RepID=UPI001ED8BDF1|nr:uncharacterized protein LOC124154450 isoform X2 [Ischnura elegans]
MKNTCGCCKAGEAENDVYSHCDVPRVWIKEPETPLKAVNDFPGPGQWNFKAKNISNLPETSREEISSEDFEEIRVLSLDDVKVYKRLVPRNTSPLRELWKQNDFPGLQNLEANRGAKGWCCCQTDRPVNKNSRENINCPRSVVKVSTCCQTDDNPFRVDISTSTPDAVLCRKVPAALRGTVMNIISCNHENQSVIVLLSCLLLRFMVNVLHRRETLEVLSPSDVKHVESILTHEVKNLGSFASRSVRGQNRLQAINACFSDLFRKYPGLQALPGFSDFINNFQGQ